MDDKAREHSRAFLILQYLYLGGGGWSVGATW